MKKVAMILSAVGLVATTVPSVLLFTGDTHQDTVKTAALIGTLVWFAATPIWMGRDLPVDAAEVEI